MSREVMRQALDAFEAGTYAAEEAAIFALRKELAKPERQPLTTPQYVEVLGPLLYQVVCSAGTLRRIVRAIEAAHGIKEQP